MLKENKPKQTNRILLIISLLLFLYTAIRAYLLSITWDEAYSYLEYIRYGIFIEDKPGEMSANNHFLNTWLCIYLVKIFGVSEFVLRTPSLIAHIIFLFSSAKLVTDFKNKWVVISSFLIINCNPYIVDFFSLSRGYALSISLMILSIYYLVNYLKKAVKIKYAIFSLLAAALATLSNIVLFNYFLVLFTLFSFLLTINFIKQKELRLKYVIHFLFIENIVLIILLFIIPIVLKLRAAGAFFYGADHSFWSDTVTTSVFSCLYGLKYGHWVVVMLKVILLATIGVSFGYVLLIVRKRQITIEIKIIFSILFLIAATALVFILQHYLLHSLYLIDRTTIFYIVLFNLLLVYLLAIILKNNKRLIFIHIFLLALTLVHFFRAVNFSYVWEWKTNYCIEQMIKDLENERLKSPQKSNISVGTPLAFEMGINYYRETNKLYWLNKPDRTEQTNPLQDYWFLETDSAKIISKRRYDTINSYHITKSVFAKPKRKPEISKTIFRKTLDYSFSKKGVCELKPEVIYSQGFLVPISDSLLNKKFTKVISKYTLKVPYDDLGKTGLIISFENQSGVHVWKMVLVKELITNKKGWNEITFSSIVPKEIREEDILKSYIWNDSKKNIYIKKAELKWEEYND